MTKLTSIEKYDSLNSLIGSSNKFGKCMFVVNFDRKYLVDSENDGKIINIHLKF